jgi:hypothetical protein
MELVTVTGEEWGELKSDIKHIKDKVDLIDQLPCKQAENNPITRIANIEKRMGWTEKIGLSIALLIGAAAAAITKFFGLAGGGDGK